jgi:hypothetical protein
MRYDVVCGMMRCGHSYWRKLYPLYYYALYSLCTVLTMHCTHHALHSYIIGMDTVHCTHSALHSCIIGMDTVPGGTRGGGLSTDYDDGQSSDEEYSLGAERARVAKIRAKKARAKAR